MYDLRVGPRESPEVAIECVSATDPDFTEAWNVGPARGPLSRQLQGDWNVTIAVTASIKSLTARLQRILVDLEERGILTLRVDSHLDHCDPALFKSLSSLKITRVQCYAPIGSGTVYLSLPGRGGVVDEYGNAVPGWLGDFLRHSKCEDVLSKLQESGARHRHIFVIVNRSGAPWPVESYLMRNIEHTPIHSPDLPPPVTAAWVIGWSCPKGLYWDGCTWLIIEVPYDD